MVGSFEIKGVGVMVLRYHFDDFPNVFLVLVCSGCNHPIPSSQDLDDVLIEFLLNV
jgi:hypothetical protein